MGGKVVLQGQFCFIRTYTYRYVMCAYEETINKKIYMYVMIEAPVLFTLYYDNFVAEPLNCYEGK